MGLGDQPHLTILQERAPGAGSTLRPITNNVRGLLTALYSNAATVHI
ncbi:hypothetical protein TIFTF001_044377 [Ficus carica]|uniref:Uncharacterized protein n=1 Tax=Ficus carica TaxID=3494 RepID=A0AA88CSB5_FICCA|nr:hypothetical protein TIFTF001_044364 [Ficus carica]GMN29635.1 hypothetical protein TIFTF001_044369 [Ficus carica]GMN29663.1 hypothetical protein TIFTF001_044372 [Ficus carica]GMN29698.1 hypothetical protein TIFTF001_044377 [Ficus carica]